MVERNPGASNSTPSNDSTVAYDWTDERKRLMRIASRWDEDYIWVYLPKHSNTQDKHAK